MLKTPPISDAMEPLRLRGVGKTFTNRRASYIALSDIEIEVASGELVAIVGPSGAGKSTLLRIISGLDHADAGSIERAGRKIDALSPQQRRIAMIFQDDALLPDIPVGPQLWLVNRVSDARVRELLGAFAIETLLRRTPRGCSGGERQRVALVRALLCDPTAILFDEPLAHLDSSSRDEVLIEIDKLRTTFTGPMLYVTHDHVEAMRLADRIAVLIDGRIEQIGTPQIIFDAPVNLRVARSFGTPVLNVLDGIGPMFGAPDELVAFRPERAALQADAPLRGTVERLQRTGSDVILRIQTVFGPASVRVVASDAPHLQEAVGIMLHPSAMMLFSRHSGQRLG